MNFMNFDPTMKKVIQCHEEPLESIQIPVVIDNEQYIVRQQVLKRTEIVKTFEFRKCNERAGETAPHFKQPRFSNNINLEEIINSIRSNNSVTREPCPSNYITQQGNPFSAPAPLLQPPNPESAPKPNCRAGIQQLIDWSDCERNENISAPYPLHYTTATSSTEISPQSVWKKPKKSVRLNASRLLFPSLHTSRGTNTTHGKRDVETLTDDEEESCAGLQALSARAQMRQNKERDGQFCQNF